MIKEIMLASALSIIPSTSIRRINIDNFGITQEYLATQFTSSLSTSYSVPFELYTYTADFVVRNLNVSISVDRTNQIFRYQFTYTDDDTLNHVFTNNALIDLAEEINDTYFYLTFDDYVELDTKYEFYCMYGDLGITYDYTSQNGDFISDMYTDMDLMDIHFYLPNIFFNSFCNYYLSLSYDIGGQEEIARLEGIIEELEVEVSTLENANRVLQENNNSLNQTNTDLQNQIIVLNQYKTQLENQVNTLQTNYNEIYSLYENLLIENEELTSQNDELRLENEQLNSKHVLSNVFDIVRGAFNGLVDFLEIEIMPNLTIGTLMFIPVVIGVIFFILKALVL